MIVKGLVKFFYLDKVRGIFIVIFQEKAQRDAIYKVKSWIYHGSSLLLQPWIPKFKPELLEVKFVPS